MKVEVQWLDDEAIKLEDLGVESQSQWREVYMSFLGITYWTLDELDNEKVILIQFGGDTGVTVIKWSQEIEDYLMTVEE